MNIAFLSTAFLRGMKESTGITLITLARTLIDRGHSVAIITERREGYPPEEHVRGVPIYRLFPGRVLAHVRAVRALQRRGGITFDVIHGFSAAPALALRTFLVRVLAAPQAATVHTLKSYSRSSRGFAWLLRLVDRVTVPTDVMRQRLCAGGAPPGKTLLLRSFIDLARFAPRGRHPLRKRYGFTGKKVLLYYGSLFEKKGVMHLLCAFPAVLRAHPSSYLVIAPRHAVPDDYRAVLEDPALKPHVKLITMEIAVEEYVSAADVVVLPYIDLIGTEGNPSCLLESVACRTPVVTTRQPELLEIFDERELFYAEPADDASLAEAIVSVLREPAEAKRRAERAFKKIGQFDVRKVAAQFLRLYQGKR